MNFSTIPLVNCSRLESLKTSFQLWGSRTAQQIDSLIRQVLRRTSAQTFAVLLLFSQLCGEFVKAAEKNAMVSLKEIFGPSTPPHSTVVL